MADQLVTMEALVDQGDMGPILVLVQVVMLDQTTELRLVLGMVATMQVPEDQVDMGPILVMAQVVMLEPILEHLQAEDMEHLLVEVMEIEVHSQPIKDRPHL